MATLTQRPNAAGVGRNGTSDHVSQNGTTEVEPEKADKQRNQIMNAALVICCLNQMTMFIYLNAMPFLWKKADVSTTTFGWIQTGHSILQLLSGPVLGRLADTAGSRTCLLLVMVSSSLSILLLGLSYSLPMLLLSRLASVLLDIQPSTQMLVTDIVPPEHRAKALRKVVGISMSLALVLGPLIGVVLSNQFGPNVTCVLASVIPLIEMVIALKYIPRNPKLVLKAADTKPEEKKPGLSWTKIKSLLCKGDTPFLLTLRVLAVLPMMIFAMNFGIAGIQFFNMSQQQAGFYMTLNGVTSMVNNLFVIGWITQNVGERNILRYATIASCFVFYFMMNTSQLWQLCLITPVMGLTFFLIDNQIMERITRNTDQEDSSTMVGVAASCYQTARALSPAIGGNLMALYGWPAIGGSGVIISVIMTAFVFFMG